VLTEMDTNAILERQPQLVLIDELAHINIPGSERDRRYQDVEAILEAGIDVYSTVNIQHLEKHRNLVTQMTGIVVRELIPEHLLEMAKEVVVVDITPERLKERLQDGQIYPLNEIEQSWQKLFQRRNLLMLRELALREVADKIEHERIKEANQLCNHGDAVTEACCIHERILVCVSLESNSLELIRRGAKMADYMNAPFYVMLVQNCDTVLNCTEKLCLEKCASLVQDLKGEFLQVSGRNVAEVITKVAKSYRITQVVLGQSHRSKWQILLSGSLVNQLVRSLTQVDIHIIAIEK
jgi:two-component system, OmpR family, sensor histidine kinase KdpD